MDVLIVNKLNRCVLGHILCFDCPIIRSFMLVDELTSYVVQHIVVAQSFVRHRDTCGRFIASGLWFLSCVPIGLIGAVSVNAMC